MNIQTISFNDYKAVVSIPEKEDHISEKWQQGHFYEAHAQGMLPRVFELRERYENGIAIDIGAHWGNHSIFFAVALRMQVFAFEPRPESFELLKQNTRMHNITCREVVMGAEEFARYSLVEGPEGNTGMTSFKKRAYKAAHTNENPGIAGSRLDTLYPNFSEIKRPLKLIKIDVEGSELNVVQGALQTIKQYSPDLWVETDCSDEVLNLINIGRSDAQKYRLEGPYNHTATWRFYTPPTP